MINTLIYLLEGFPNQDILTHETEPNELIPDVGDYIEFDDYTTFPESIRKQYGSLFKIDVRRIAYSIDPGYASQLFIHLYVIPVSKEEHDYMYQPEE